TALRLDPVIKMAPDQAPSGRDTVQPATVGAGDPKSETSELLGKLILDDVDRSNCKSVFSLHAVRSMYFRNKTILS
ncbi:hypothetical protein ABTH71_20355, partial [Acinetobacter baumannii]